MLPASAPFDKHRDHGYDLCPTQKNRGNRIGSLFSFMSPLQQMCHSGALLFEPGPLTLHLEQLGIVTAEGHQLTMGTPLIHLTA